MITRNTLLLYKAELDLTPTPRSYYRVGHAKLQYIGSKRQRQPAALAKIEIIRQYKKSGCVRCGFDDHRALVFHHRVPALKKFNIGGTGLNSGIPQLVKELRKCDVLCANCHNIFHFTR
jgi:hypothetical protein